MRNQVDEKKRMLQAISANVSSEGQSLFIAIAKTINEVRWRNSEIVIWNHEVQNVVTIIICSFTDLKYGKLNFVRHKLCSSAAFVKRKEKYL